MQHLDATKGNAPAASTVEASKAETPQASKESSMNSQKESTMNSTETISTAQLAPSLTIENGQVTTTSLQVAEHFGKRHRDVIRAINNLISQLPPEGVRNFAQGYYTLPETADQQHKMYHITRDGFSLLAMGFTGNEALQWKLAYITAFNKMERDLRAGHDYTRINPEQAQHLRELVELVAATGKQSHGETWARLQRKFKVNSYHELATAKFGEACDYLRGKMTKEDIGGLVQKHFAVQPELLDVKGQFELNYGEGRQLYFTPEQQAAINQKAFDMGKEVFDLSVAHVTMQVYGTIPGNQTGRVSDQQVKKAIDKTTLSSALMGKYSRDLFAAGQTAELLIKMTKDSKLRFDKELKRIGFGNLIEKFS
jgi:Rha family phage regulatory protein